MGKKKGTILMVTGLLLIAAALFLTLFNIYDSKRAGQEAEQVVGQIIGKIEQAQQEKQEQSEAGVDVTPDYELDSAIEMPSVKVGEFRYIGLLEIPALNRQLPIMAECTDRGLRKAPCCYTGSVYEDSMVIAGHNYLSHFAGLRGLPLGSEVYFTDMEGNRYALEISDLRYKKHADQTTLQSCDAALTLFIKNVYAFEYLIVFCDIPN